MNLTQLLTSENQTITTIISVVFAIIQPILFHRIFTLLLDIKSTKIKELIFVSTISICSITAMILPNSILKDCLVIIPFIIVLKLLFKLSAKNTLLAIFLSYFCAIIVEAIVDFTFIHVFNLNLDNMLNIPLYYLLVQTSGSILLYVCPVLIKKVKSRAHIFHVDLPPKIIIGINFVLGIITMLLETYLFSSNIDTIPLQLTIAILVTTLAYFFITMCGLIRTNILEKTEEDLENEKLYNKTLSILHDNIRGFKHDFNNIVQAIGGYIALNDFNGLKTYYAKLLDDCKLTNNLNLLNPESINNPSIYSLLTNKYFIASEKKISMNFSIFSDLSKITSNTYEISRILGILLDNAIEAADESNKKIIYIETKSNDKKHSFIIKNTCKDTSISTTQIFEKGYSTKNRNSGLGLWNVHKILSKNTNLDLFTSIEDDFFSQQLDIYY